MTTPRPSLTPLAGVRPEDQYTVQTSLAVLKAALPAFHFSPHLAIITDGKAVGEAIRLTGPNLVYVRFPVNETGHAVSFTLPRGYLIPLTVRPIVKPPISASFTSSSPCGVGGSSYAAQSIGGSSFANHGHVELGYRLGEEGEPALCVVCGRWDEEAGQKRRSGHKCRGCVGQKSLGRLRMEFERLATSATVPLAQEQLSLIDGPEGASPPMMAGSPYNYGSPVPSRTASFALQEPSQDTVEQPRNDEDSLET